MSEDKMKEVAQAVVRSRKLGMEKLLKFGGIEMPGILDHETTDSVKEKMKEKGLQLHRISDPNGPDEFILLRKDKDLIAVVWVSVKDRSDLGGVEVSGKMITDEEYIKELREELAK